MPGLLDDFDYGSFFYVKCERCRAGMIDENGEASIHWALCCPEHAPIAKAEAMPFWVRSLRVEEEKLETRLAKGVEWINDNTERSDAEIYRRAITKIGKMDARLNEIRATFKILNRFHCEQSPAAHLGSQS